MITLTGVTHRHPEILSGTPVFVGRRVIHRILHWNPQLPTLFRLAAVLKC